MSIARATHKPRSGRKRRHMSHIYGRAESYKDEYAASDDEDEEYIDEEHPFSRPHRKKVPHFKTYPQPKYPFPGTSDKVWSFFCDELDNPEMMKRTSGRKKPISQREWDKYWATIRKTEEERQNFYRNWWVCLQMRLESRGKTLHLDDPPARHKKKARLTDPESIGDLRSRSPLRVTITDVPSPAVPVALTPKPLPAPSTVAVAPASSSSSSSLSAATTAQPVVKVVLPSPSPSPDVPEPSCLDDVKLSQDSSLPFVSLPTFTREPSYAVLCLHDKVLSCRRCTYFSDTVTVLELLRACMDHYVNDAEMVDVKYFLSQIAYAEGSAIDLSTSEYAKEACSLYDLRVTLRQ